MNPILAAIAAATVVLLAAGAFCTWKVLTRIGQAVQHLEEHLEQPGGILDGPVELTDGQAEEFRASLTREGFFAPNPREGS